MRQFNQLEHVYTYASEAGIDHVLDAAYLTRIQESDNEFQFMVKITEERVQSVYRHQNTLIMDETEVAELYNRTAARSANTGFFYFVFKVPQHDLIIEICMTP